MYDDTHYLRDKYYNKTGRNPLSSDNTCLTDDYTEWVESELNDLRNKYKKEKELFLELYYTIFPMTKSQNADFICMCKECIYKLKEK